MPMPILSLAELFDVNDSDTDESGDGGCSDFATTTTSSSAATMIADAARNTRLSTTLPRRPQGPQVKTRSEDDDDRRGGANIERIKGVYRQS